MKKSLLSFQCLKLSALCLSMFALTACNDQAASNATFTAQSSRTHLSAMYGVFTNPSGAAVTINSITAAGGGSNPLSSDQITLMNVDPDTHNASDLCTQGEEIPAGGSCKVWIKVTNGPDITAETGSAQTGVLTLNTSAGLFSLNLSVTTDLYAEGYSATTKYVGGSTGWQQVASGAHDFYSIDKTSLDVLLGAVYNNGGQYVIGYYNGTSSIGSLGAAVEGDTIADGALSGGSNNGNNEYVYANTFFGGAKQTLDITNGYGGTWQTLTGSAGQDSAAIIGGALYTGASNAAYTSTDGLTSSAISPAPGVGSVWAFAKLNGVLYVVGNGSTSAQYFSGGAWSNVTGASVLYGIVNWNNTLYASGPGGIYKLTSPTTLTSVSSTGQGNASGLIASTNALYMIQSNSHVQRCTGASSSVTCNDLGASQVGSLDSFDSDIVIAPELTISS